MNQFSKILVTLVAPCFLLISCADSSGGGSPGAIGTPGEKPAPPGPPPPPSDVLSFANISEQVFATRCYTCHERSAGNAEGDVGLDYYAEVLSNKDRIFKSVVTKKTMPPGEPLTDWEYTLMKRWLEAKAPYDESSIQPPEEEKPPRQKPDKKAGKKPAQLVGIQ